jgi:hypothetical protein
MSVTNNNNNNRSTRGRGRSTRGKRGRSSSTGAWGKRPKARVKPEIPAYALYTRKQISFNKVASGLDAKLKEAYGQQANISNFEKAVSQLETCVNQDHLDLVFIEEELLDSLSEYLKLRAARVAERNSFRSEKKISVESTTIDSVKEKLAKTLRSS